MQLYRITLAKYTYQLYASGYPGRWNSKGIPVIYCSWSRSLACLENLVHRSNLVLSDIFSVMLIDVDDHIERSKISLEELESNWHTTNPSSYRVCQAEGDRWFKGLDSCVLEVPSAIIHAESNYVLNPRHPDFKHVKLIGKEEFSFDPRVFSIHQKKKS